MRSTDFFFTVSVEIHVDSLDRSFDEKKKIE